MSPRTLFDLPLAAFIDYTSLFEQRQFLYLQCLWFSIHDQMELFIVYMEKVWLKVQTVPATDPVTLQEHIAYNVIAQDGDGDCIRLAPGWTLRDAIETFCEWFQVERERVCILRPFIPQSVIFYE